MSQPSANNAEQFKQSFREEGREVLVDLEAALLELNENRADMELVGRVFRALHTIKGLRLHVRFRETSRLYSQPGGQPSTRCATDASRSARN